MNMNKRETFLLVGTMIIGSLVPLSLFSFSSGSISIYEKAATPDGSLYACAISERVTGFPFTVLNFYSPGCPADLSVKFNVLGFILDILVFTLGIKLISRITRGHPSANS